MTIIDPRFDPNKPTVPYMIIEQENGEKIRYPVVIVNAITESAAGAIRNIVREEFHKYHVELAAQERVKGKKP